MIQGKDKNQQKAQIIYKKIITCKFYKYLFSLINSYKIKSLVLERNPKEDFNKEKKFVKKILEFKNKSINL